MGGSRYKEAVVKVVYEIIDGSGATIGALVCCDCRYTVYERIGGLYVKAGSFDGKDDARLFISGRMSEVAELVFIDPLSFTGHGWEEIV